MKRMVRLGLIRIDRGGRSSPIAMAALAACVFLADRPLMADVVHLTNGRSFEDVIAEVGESDVTIRMAFGTMRLPLSRVDRVEKAASGLAEYLLRAEALRLSGSLAAGDWLKLSLWARTQGLDHGVREAALLAADLDPDLPELSSVMRSLNYVRDTDMDRWVPFADSMRRQGFVLADGIWISREEMAERRRLAESERMLLQEQRQAEKAAAEQAELALYRQVVLEAAVASLMAPPPPIYASYVGYPVYSTPFIYPGRPVHLPMLPPSIRPHHNPGHSDAVAANRAAIVSRQPGSILPIVVRSHTSSTRTIR